MPRVSEFRGITIYVHRGEHGPPHFHAVHGDDEVLVRIDQIEHLAGHLPRRLEGLVLRWARLHRMELLENWDFAQTRRPLKIIDPLD